MQNSYYSNSRKEIFERIIELAPGRVLEVGCGHGVMLSSLSRVWPGFDHVGVDMHANPSPLNGYRFVNSDITKISGNDIGQFDLIVMLDVLEHISDGYAVLEHLKTFSKKNTVFVFSIPNIRFAPALFHILINRDFPELDFGVFDRTHVRFYTKKKIVRLMNQANFLIKRIEGINSIMKVQPTYIRKVAAFFVAPIAVLFGLDSLHQQFFVLATVE